MKSGKTKSVFLIFLTALMLAIFFGFFVARGGSVYAEENAAENSSNSSGCRNFIYSALFNPDTDAEQAGFVFGSDGKSGWIAAAKAAENRIVLYRHEEEDVELKAVGYDFTDIGQFKMTLVVNEEVARIFIGDEDVAKLTCKLDGYKGGETGVLGLGISNVTLTETDTPDGDIFIGGYDVLRVVNLTDGNYVLSSGEYSLKAGVLTVSRDYLKTLECDKEYSFRVVTSFTEFTVKIETDFTSVTATPSVEKYYRNSDVTLELSGNVKVHKLLIDEKEYEFTQTEDRVVISSEQISTLSIGNHRVKLFTDKGRPETTITVAETVETITEPIIKSAHVWLWIDISIFAAAIIGYITFSVLSKRKKK